MWVIRCIVDIDLLSIGGQSMEDVLQLHKSRCGQYSTAHIIDAAKVYRSFYNNSSIPVRYVVPPLAQFHPSVHGSYLGKSTRKLRVMAKTLEEKQQQGVKLSTNEEELLSANVTLEQLRLMDVGHDTKSLTDDDASARARAMGEEFNKCREALLIYVRVHSSDALLAGGESQEQLLSSSTDGNVPSIWPALSGTSVHLPDNYVVMKRDENYPRSLWGYALGALWRQVTTEGHLSSHANDFALSGFELAASTPTRIALR